MEPISINLRELSKIPEKEFKEHFREWMEQDDIARSLQAKLRKDLVLNFNKTTLGKKIIAQAAATHRLTLSPLILALNTLVAEFLYAQNCHFTLSVFCTEVPYRNTLPDFEAARHFRFSESEIFEIFDALSAKWDKGTKDEIFNVYSKENTSSLLLVVLRCILTKSKEVLLNEDQPDVEPTQDVPNKSQKPDSKPENKCNNFRYLNKYLIVLSKKVKEMSKNLEVLKKHGSPPQDEKNSFEAKKFENLNRSLEKISENLRQMSVSKKKKKTVSAVVSAIDTMSKQFERCAVNFDQISKGYANLESGDGPAQTEKSYNSWIREMRTTENGKRFLEKIEASLRKTLHRERDKMEHELEQRVQIHKDILKNKYKQKLQEELAKYTERKPDENFQKLNESFEMRLKEFETRHQELYQKVQEAQTRPKQQTPAPKESSSKHCAIQIDDNGTQTSTDVIAQATDMAVANKNQLQQMISAVTQQERQVDHIVFDAKLRIQKLEHESNQLDRSFHDYLERQRSEKQKMRDTATSILQSYALERSLLDKKSAIFRATPRTMEKHPASAFPVVFDGTVAVTSIPTINIDTTNASVNPPEFENPFRVAQRKVLARSKTLPPPLPHSTDIEPSADTRQQQQRQQRPTTFQLIEHPANEDTRTKVAQKQPAQSLSPRHVSTQATLFTQLSPELNLKDITLDGIEISPSTAKSSSLRSSDSTGSVSSPRGVFKLKRQLFTTTDNGSPSSSNGQQMNSNGNKEAEEPLRQINKEHSDAAKKSIGDDKKDVAVNKEFQLQVAESAVTGKTSEKCAKAPRGETTLGGVAPTQVEQVEEDAWLPGLRLGDLTGGTMAEIDSDNDFWA